MTIEQTIEIPADRRLFIDVPPQFPVGRATLRLIKQSSAKPYRDTDEVDSRVLDGVNRFKKLNNTDIDFLPAKPLLLELKSLPSSITVSRVTFYAHGAKIRIQFIKTEFIIDFDFEEPDIIFITTFKDETMLVKDCKICDLQKTLELF